MGALGHQAAAALHQPVTGLRLVTDTPQQERYPLPEDWEPLGYSDRARAADNVRTIQALRGRVAELEADLAAVQRDTERRIKTAIAEIERQQTATSARTMGGKVLSIFEGPTR